MIATSLYHAVIRSLLESGFFLVLGESGNPLLGENITPLQYSAGGINALVEVVDTSSFTTESLYYILENKLNVLSRMPPRTALINVFVFAAKPEKAVMDMLEGMQAVVSDERRSVLNLIIAADMGKPGVIPLYKAPFSTRFIENPLKKATARDYLNSEPLTLAESVRIEKDNRLSPVTKSTPATFILSAVNVVMLLLMDLIGDSEDGFTLLLFGARYNPLIVAGQYWRLITPMFLHIGITHLVVNSYSLYNLRIVENLYGSFRFLIIYILSGFLGNVASFAFSSGLSAGASGAIFGLVGALLYVWKSKPKAFKRFFNTYSLVAVLAINIVFGFTSSGIDNFGHLGGLLGGFLAAWAVDMPKTTSRRPAGISANDPENPQLAVHTASAESRGIPGRIGAGLLFAVLAATGILIGFIRTGINPI